jgi:hypothetical protein
MLHATHLVAAVTATHSKAVPSGTNIFLVLCTSNFTRAACPHYLYCWHLGEYVEIWPLQETAGKTGIRCWWRIATSDIISFAPQKLTCLSEWVNIFVYSTLLPVVFMVFYVTQLNLCRQLRNEKIHDLKTSQDINYGNQEEWDGGVVSSMARREINAEFWRGNLKGWDYLEFLSVIGKNNIKMSLKEDGKVWIGLIWIRMPRIGGLL